MATHTDGPWIVKTSENLDGYPHAIMRHVINTEDGKPICALWHRNKPYRNPIHFKAGNFITDEQEVDANARLIAAAPDLYAALLDIRHNIKNDDPAMWERIDAAIAKAEPIGADVTGG